MFMGQIGSSCMTLPLHTLHLDMPYAPTDDNEQLPPFRMVPHDISLLTSLSALLVTNGTLNGKGGMGLPSGMSCLEGLRSLHLSTIEITSCEGSCSSAGDLVLPAEISSLSLLTSLVLSGTDMGAEDLLLFPSLYQLEKMGGLCMVLPHDMPALSQLTAIDLKSSSLANPSGLQNLE